MEKRVKFEIYIDDIDRIRFNTIEQAEAFQKALGYIIQYGLNYNRGIKEETDIKSIIFGKDLTTFEILSNFDGGQTIKGGFTMGGIARKDGTEYSFHS